ncbi:MAG: VWA domain-containing protein [Bacteroidetes bacterium]|nr:VWA domain-containing protein [Bacteroidota bacterium]
MKRYIEIVFDNSISMRDILTGNQTRIQVAKALFEKEVFPELREDDQINIRTLRSYCDGTSRPVNTNIKTIKYDVEKIDAKLGETPLFNTVKDAVEACKKSMADEKIIFVLTDGDDTCNVDPTNFFTPEEQKFIRTLNVILMQFAINNHITRQNLNLFASQIGAQTFSVGASGRADFSSMRTDLRSGLGNAGFVTGANRNITPVYPGYMLSWSELNNRGIRFYQAELLFNEGFLSWKPEPNKPLEGKQWSELLFLWSLRFLNGLPVEIIRAMLMHLSKPYAYSQSNMYWDFEKTRWITLEAKPTERIPNPEPEIMDVKQLNQKQRDTEYHQWYDEDVLYEVEKIEQNNAAGTNGYKLVRWQCKTDLFVKPKPKKLKAGDVVQFVKPSKRGRKRKAD